MIREAYRRPFAPGLPDPVREAAFYRGVTVKRGLAWAVDGVLVAILCTLILPFTLFTALLFWPILWGVVSFLYRWVALSTFSATFGMLLFAIELREGDGGRLGPLTAFLHTAGYTASLVVFPVQLVSIALMVVLGRGQGLTDLVLGTAMIRRAA